MTNHELWEWVLAKARVILGVAGSITMTLWVKRTSERLTDQQVIDHNIVANGLNRRGDSLVLLSFLFLSLHFFLFFPQLICLTLQRLSLFLSLFA